MLTGQTAQRRAADPDGWLLAVGYGLSAEPARNALRSALASAGDLDLLRACLELRFEADVGLADTRPTAGADDVGLGHEGAVDFVMDIRTNML